MKLCDLSLVLREQVSYKIMVVDLNVTVFLHTISRKDSESRPELEFNSGLASKEMFALKTNKFVFLL